MFVCIYVLLALLYMIICIVLYLFSLLSETQPTKVDYNAAHDKNTYVTETRAIDDYLLDHR
jgi:hypothetical protein